MFAIFHLYIKRNLKSRQLKMNMVTALASLFISNKIPRHKTDTRMRRKMNEAVD